MSEGSNEQIAERLFSEVGVDRFLLEYDTGRAASSRCFIRPGTTGSGARPSGVPAARRGRPVSAASGI